VAGAARLPIVPARLGSLPLAGFIAYVVISMLTRDHPRWPILAASLWSRVRARDLVFPLAMAPWRVSGVPGLRRVAWMAGAEMGMVGFGCACEEAA